MSEFIHYNYVQLFESPASDGDIAFYLRLAIAAGAEKRCSVSIAALAQWMRSTKRRVRKAVSRLEELGFITVERTAGGCGRVNTYHIVPLGKKRHSQAAADKTGADKTGAVNSENGCFQRHETVNKETPVKNKEKIIYEKDLTESKTFSTQGVLISSKDSLFLTYPTRPEDIMKSFPDADIGVVSNYLRYRTAAKWRKMSGHKISPREVPDDFSCWLRRERKLLSPTPPPPPPLPAEQECGGSIVDNWSGLINEMGIL